MGSNVVKSKLKTPLWYIYNITNIEYNVFYILLLLTFKLKYIIPAVALLLISSILIKRKSTKKIVMLDSSFSISLLALIFFI